MVSLWQKEREWMSRTGPRAFAGKPRATMRSGGAGGGVVGPLHSLEPFEMGRENQRARSGCRVVD